MRRGPRFKQLLTSAERRTRLISFEEKEDGRIEVLWLSRRSGALSSLERFTADRAEHCLLFIIATEDRRALERHHGEDCPCEDCLIARVDEAHSKKRKP